MPCRHEGGKDPCIRFPSGSCKIRAKKTSDDWKRRNKKRAYIRNRKYVTKNYRYTESKATKCNVGEAGELFVAADLLTRGLATTKPFNRNGPDDLHVRVAAGWRNIQVKLGLVNIKTGTICLAGKRKGITSDIIALVDLRGKRIRYLSNNNEPVPPELQDD